MWKFTVPAVLIAMLPLLACLGTTPTPQGTTVAVPATAVEATLTAPTPARVQSPVAAPTAIEALASKPQLRQWLQTVLGDIKTWSTLLEDYGPAIGYSPVTDVQILESVGKIEIGVNCQENLSVVQMVIQQRLTALEVPLDVVDFVVGERARPSVMGHNRLEECGEPHPAQDDCKVGEGGLQR